MFEAVAVNLNHTSSSAVPPQAPILAVDVVAPQTVPGVVTEHVAAEFTVTVVAEHGSSLAGAEHGGVIQTLKDDVCPEVLV